MAQVRKGPLGGGAAARRRQAFGPQRPALEKIIKDAANERARTLAYGERFRITHNGITYYFRRKKATGPLVSVDFLGAHKV